MTKTIPTGTVRVLAFIAYVFLSCGTCAAESVPASGTTGFILDGNRVYAELSFVRPDGTLHKTLAYVDMGTPSMSLAAPLFDELHPDQDHPLTFRLGDFTVTLPAAEVSNGHEPPHHLGQALVEAILPAGVLKKYQVVLDYRKRTLVLAQPGTLAPAGVATPFHMNEQTGIIAVDAVIDGKPYALTIDNGSAWTWLRQSAVTDWLSVHPGWARGIGAVGPSNMMMVGDLEATGVLARLPSIEIGTLALTDVDVLGPGASRAFPFELFDWYSRKNALPVLGWIGGNVLKRYRLTIDYPNRMLYWQRQSKADGHDLDQVGLTLRTQSGEYFVAGVATKDGRPTVAGVEPGDKLVQVDSLVLKGATWGAIFAAMHGRPGSRRVLILERDGKTLTVNAMVTAF